jgi:hypothetical protein
MLTPFLVARSQLLTAIDLFFEDRDPISVQALAANARELLERLCRLDGIEPMTELLVRDNQRPKKDIYRMMNLYRNCFKHLGDTQVERDDDQQTLNQFDDTKNEYLLYICVEDYLRLRHNRSPVAMQVFQLWFIALHRELLENPPEFALVMRERFPGILEMRRNLQKRTGLVTLKKFAGDPVLLADPRTEPAILSSD